jgi:PAS domain S-box-containing protein
LLEVETSLAEARLVEASLRETADRYRLLADSMEDIVGLADTHGGRLYVSPSYYRLTGWTPAEVLATDWRTRVHPDDLPRIEAAHRANLRGEATWAEYRCRCKNGTFVWLEVRATPIRDNAGDVEKILWCSRDVSELQAGRGTHAAGGGRRALGRGRPGHRGRARRSTRTAIVYTNPAFARITGYDDDEVRGKTPQLLHGPESDRATLERVWALRAGESVRVEVVQYRKDRSPYWADLWSSR